MDTYTMRSYFLVGDWPVGDWPVGDWPVGDWPVGDWPDPRGSAKPGDILSPYGSATKLDNGMFSEFSRFVMDCRDGSNGILSECQRGIWTPPLDCTGSNNLFYFKIEKPTSIDSLTTPDVKTKNVLSMNLRILAECNIKS